MRFLFCFSSVKWQKIELSTFGPPYHSQPTQSTVQTMMNMFYALICDLYFTMHNALHDHISTNVSSQCSTSNRNDWNFDVYFDSKIFFYYYRHFKTIKTKTGRLGLPKSEPNHYLSKALFFLSKQFYQHYRRFTYYQLLFYRRCGRMLAKC